MSGLSDAERREIARALVASHRADAIFIAVERIIADREAAAAEHVADLRAALAGGES